MHVEFKRTLIFSVGSYQIVIHLENYKQANLNNPCQQSSVTNERKPFLFQVSEIFIKITVVKTRPFFGSHKEGRGKDRSLLRNG